MLNQLFGVSAQLHNTFVGQMSESAVSVAIFGSSVMQVDSTNPSVVIV